ncbi:hypothetical protein GCM10027299_36910 [Larkinella ripae]
MLGVVEYEELFVGVVVVVDGVLMEAFVELVRSVVSVPVSVIVVVVVVDCTFVVSDEIP